MSSTEISENTVALCAEPEPEPIARYLPDCEVIAISGTCTPPDDGYARINATDANRLVSDLIKAMRERATHLRQVADDARAAANAADRDAESVRRIW